MQVDRFAGLRSERTSERARERERERGGGGGGETRRRDGSGAGRQTDIASSVVWSCP